MAKIYLGDGVYADEQDGQIVVTVEDGTRATDTVVFEPPLLIALIRYARSQGWDVRG